MTNNEWGFITLPTHADPEQRAIARLKLSSEMSLEHYKTPLLLTHSGGKDSCVLTELALRAEIPFEVLHAHTTADAPETVHFVRSEFARLENRGIRCSINYPLYKGRRTSMWDLIPRKLMPPTRVARYCCAVLKEQNGKGRFLATGVRWAESVSRSKRRGIFEKQVSNRDKEVHIRNDEESLDALFAPCKLAAKRFVNPIVDWSDREVWDLIIFRAIELLKELIKLLIQKQEQQKARISDLMERRNEKQEKQPAPSVTQTDNQTIPAVTQPFKAPATTTAEKTVIPPRPRMSELAHDYEMRLEEIMEKLKRQNRAIHTQEVKKDLIDEDLKNCTGLFQGKKRKELQAQSNKYAETIKIMKQGLSHIVQDYKYPTVDAFLQVYKQGKSEYESYVKANKEWNSKYGENSIHRKLAEKQAEVQKREQDRDFNYRSPSDRGAR